jgi:hypothetical protein
MRHEALTDDVGSLGEVSSSGEAVVLLFSQQNLLSLVSISINTRSIQPYTRRVNRTFANSVGNAWEPMTENRLSPRATI